MAGHKKWKTLRDKMTPEQREESARLKRQFDQELLLERVREARGLTQQEVAKTLRTSQANVSKMEKRADLMVSTLAKYIHAMGGDLELRAIFPGLGSVRLKGLAELHKD
jgi:transcriptional regulator with XRE-family HTH domain